MRRTAAGKRARESHVFAHDTARRDFHDMENPCRSFPPHGKTLSSVLRSEPAVRLKYLPETPLARDLLAAVRRRFSARKIFFSVRAAENVNISNNEPHNTTINP
jgi:hypothetical protein